MTNTPNKTRIATPTFIEQLKERKDEDQVGEVEEIIMSFKETPVSIKEKLDEYVISQERGKKIIATEIFFHYKRIQEALKNEMANNGGDFKKALQTIQTPKANILIIGPSGTGKTYTMEVASKIVKIPFVKEDMTAFTEAGYVGRDVNQILIDLIKTANNNLYLAQLGIVFLDEIDKKFKSRIVGRDVSGSGVQNALLKIVEGTELYIGKELFNTDKILFVASGAFEGLEYLVMKDLEIKGVDIDNIRDWRDYVTNEHLIKYGMERQLLGRLPVKVFYYPLSKEDLVKIMKTSKDSPLHRYKADLKLIGIDLEIEDAALEVIAEKAIREGIGARGLTSVLNKVLEQERYELPSQEYRGKIILTKNVVEKRIQEQGRW